MQLFADALACCLTTAVLLTANALDVAIVLQAAHAF